jgi:hypothetical protein
VSPPGAAHGWSDEHQRLVTDVRYGSVYSDLCARLYARCDFALNVFQLVGGSTFLITAASSMLGDGKGAVPPQFTAYAGALLGIVSLVAMQWQPAVRAERHRVCASKFLELHGRAWKIKTGDLARELASAQAGAPEGPRGLKMPGYSLNVQAIGFPAEKLTAWERLLNLLA